MLLGYGAKVGLGNMRVKAENRMVTLLGQRGTLRHAFPVKAENRMVTLLGAVWVKSF